MEVLRNEKTVMGPTTGFNDINPGLDSSGRKIFSHAVFPYRDYMPETPGEILIAYNAIFSIGIARSLVSIKKKSAFRSAR
jgi:hypothetical protein